VRGGNSGKLTLGGKPMANKRPAKAANSDGIHTWRISLSSGNVPVKVQAHYWILDRRTGAIVFYNEDYHGDDVGVAVFSSGTWSWVNLEKEEKW
jgi:hypothetical protein